jgi:hypothetical protein
MKPPIIGQKVNNDAIDALIDALETLAPGGDQIRRQQQGCPLSVSDQDLALRETCMKAMVTRDREENKGCFRLG